MLYFGYPIISLESSVGTANPAATPNVAWNYLREFSGSTGTPQLSTVINDAVNVSANSVGTINGNKYSKSPLISINELTTVSNITPPHQFAMPSSPVLYINTSIPNLLGTHGVIQAQIFRTKVDKFGDVLNSKYVTTGAELDDTGISSIDVFGGDVFTQKTWFKHRQDYGSLCKW